MLAWRVANCLRWDNCLSVDQWLHHARDVEARDACRLRARVRLHGDVWKLAGVDEDADARGLSDIG